MADSAHDLSSPGQSHPIAPAIDRRESFIRHYLLHQNAAQAYREAGFKDGPGTRQSAHRLLTSAYIQSRLAEERQKLLDALDVKIEDLLRRFRDIAFADIAEIVGCHYGACRYCHGIDHAFQWRTRAEYLRSGENKGALYRGLLESEGGFGFDASRLPHPDCPMCDGRGILHVHLKDTRLLTNSERAVIAGVEQTARGVCYRFHDRLAALKELAKRLGFNNG
jgi:phage terminase small subunit